MKRLLLLALAALLAGPALGLDRLKAADLAVKASPAYAAVPAFSWDGFIVYGSVGFANLDSSQNFGSALASELNFLGVPITASASTSGAQPSASSTGFFGGGGIGVQKAYGNFLLGVRLDVDSFGQGTTAQSVIGEINTNTHLFGTGNVRAGWTFGQWYLYGTGGAAWDHVCLTDGASSACNSGVGWMAGAGVEYDIPLPQWSPQAAFFINAEYRHYSIDGIDANLVMGTVAPAAGLPPGATLATAANVSIGNQDKLDAAMISAGLKF